MFKAVVNQKDIQITPEGDGFVVDGQVVKLDVANVGEQYFHVILNNKSYRAEIISTDRGAKTVTVKVNGNRYDVQVKNKFDLLLEKMGMQNGASGKLNSIKAPMPGLIIELKVKDGDTVKQNDPLLILEAMKMENIIKAPGDGVVRSVKVQKGNSVEKNQVLIEF